MEEKIVFKSHGWLFVYLAVLILPILTYIGVRFYVGFMWDVNCGQHLKRAADANTVEMARDELGNALKYLEDHKTTEGYTTILTPLWLPPNEDVGFWFRNLKASHTELCKVGPTTTQEERGVVLLKLRQTLLDHTGQRGEKITAPSGIAFFPYNLSWFLCGVVCVFIGLPGGILTSVWLRNN